MWEQFSLSIVGFVSNSFCYGMRYCCYGFFSCLEFLFFSRPLAVWCWFLPWRRKVPCDVILIEITAGADVCGEDGFELHVCNFWVLSVGWTLSPILQNRSQFDDLEIFQFICGDFEMFGQQKYFDKRCLHDLCTWCAHVLLLFALACVLLGIIQMNTSSTCSSKIVLRAKASAA